MNKSDKPAENEIQEETLKKKEKKRRHAIIQIDSITIDTHSEKKSDSELRSGLMKQINLNKLYGDKQLYTHICMFKCWNTWGLLA